MNLTVTYKMKSWNRRRIPWLLSVLNFWFYSHCPFITLTQPSLCLEFNLYLVSFLSSWLLFPAYGPDSRWSHPLLKLKLIIPSLGWWTLCSDSWEEDSFAFKIKSKSINWIQIFLWCIAPVHIFCNGSYTNLCPNLKETQMLLLFMKIVSILSGIWSLFCRLRPRQFLNLQGSPHWWRTLCRKTISILKTLIVVIFLSSYLYIVNP